MSWKVLNVVLAFYNYVSFAWAIKKFFRVPPHGLPLRMKWLRNFGGFFAALNTLLIAKYGGSELDIVGTVLFILSAVTFYAAITANQKAPLPIAYSSLRPNTINDRGPYRYLRHPFYTSYILSWLAPVFAANCTWLLLPAVAFAMNYYIVAKEEENSLLSGDLSESYRAYRQKTGMFFPKFRGN